MAPEQRKKLCISIRMGIQMKGRILWGLEDNPPETPFPPQLRVQTSHRKRQKTLLPIPLAQGCRRSQALSSTAPASPAVQPPTSTEHPGPSCWWGWGLVWQQGHGCSRVCLLRKGLLEQFPRGPSSCSHFPSSTAALLQTAKFPPPQCNCCLGA